MAYQLIQTHTYIKEKKPLVEPKDNLSKDLNTQCKTINEDNKKRKKTQMQTTTFSVK